jgi:hypothetical protein
MLRRHGFKHSVSNGDLHLYIHEDEPSRIIHIFPHPCGAVNSYIGDNCLSWDDRLQVASIIDTITILSDRTFGRSRDNSHSAIRAVFELWFIKNYCSHAHPYTGTALSIRFLDPPNERKPIVDSSNLPCIQGRDSMYTFPLLDTDFTGERNSTQPCYNSVSFFDISSALTDRPTRDRIAAVFRRIYIIG